MSFVFGRGEAVAGTALSPESFASANASPHVLVCPLDYEMPVVHNRVNANPGVFSGAWLDAIQCL